MRGGEVFGSLCFGWKGGGRSARAGGGTRSAVHRRARAWVLPRGCGDLDRRAMRVLASSHGLLGPYDTKNALFRSETNNVRKGWGVGWRARAVVRKRRARGEAVR
jgi:hypothetical protein